MRRAVLFLLAIVAPAVLLVALSLRIMAQERELADKRVSDERRREAADVRQDLLARLEAITRNALGPHTVGSDRAVALVTQVENGHLVLPWDGNPRAESLARALDTPPFADEIRLADRDEAAGDYAKAAAAYRKAMRGVRATEQKSLAQLGIARVLAKSNRQQEANAEYRQILQVPPDVVDDQAVPFAFYAARHLLDSHRTNGSDERVILECLQRALAIDPPLPPAALYMLGGIANDLSVRASAGLAEAPEARRRLDPASDVRQLSLERIRDVEQALALQASFATLVSGGLPSTSADPIWVPFERDNHLWLVTVTTAAATNQVVAIAARAGPMLAEAAAAAGRGVHARGTIHSGGALDGEPLGRNFPGLSLTFLASEIDALGSAGRLQRSFYLAALLLVLGVALSGGYLFWRDVKRELRVAEMRSQFVSSVSHELKTPLTAIRLFAETLLMGRSARPEARDEYLDTIVNESERLTRLLNNVLDFSNIERGSKTYRLEPRSLPSIVRAAAKAMRYPLAQQGFELRVAIDDDFPLMPADSDAIEQAILNLLSNAMKYSGQGRAIDLALKVDGGQAIVEVTDRGHGVHPDEQARIFEKFYRVSTAENQRIPGTGLGLTLVEHVARAHGGRVTIKSAPGEGSTFSIVLPLPALEAKARGPAKAVAS